MSLNPALEDVAHCPRCGASAAVQFPRSLSCPACGYRAFYNPKPVAAAIPFVDDDRVILMRRGTGDATGRWTFPGGFVDLGESVEQAALRETREELCLDVALGPLLGVYSRPTDRVVLIVFTARALGGRASPPRPARSGFSRSPRCPGRSWPSGPPRPPCATPLGRRSLPAASCSAAATSMAGFPTEEESRWSS